MVIYAQQPKMNKYRALPSAEKEPSDAHFRQGYEATNPESALAASLRFQLWSLPVPRHRSSAGAMLPKALINSPGDEYEREADHVADRVMDMPATNQLGREFEMLQTKGVPPRGNGKAVVPSIVQEALTGTGQPLDRSARNFMEPRFGHEFGNVQIHTDARSAESAQALGARAYTVGQHVFFGPGQYSSDTIVGKRLLAHELTHTIQQRDERSVTRPQGQLNPLNSDVSGQVASARPSGSSVTGDQGQDEKGSLRAADLWPNELTVPDSWPNELPAMTAATVRMAENLKRQVDRVQPELMLAVRELSDTADPVIEQFRNNYRRAYSTVTDLLKDYLPDVNTLLGTMTEVTLGVATSFLPPARALYTIGRALMLQAGQVAAGQLVTELIKPEREAKRALLLAQWLSETEAAGMAAYLAPQVVKAEYDAVSDLMIGVGVPWRNKLDAEDGKDSKATRRYSAYFVAAANVFLSKAPTMTESLQQLSKSYRVAAERNNIDDEVRRILAVTAASILAEPIPSPHWYVLQGDRRPEFVERVLIPRFPDLNPSKVVYIAERHNLTVRQLLDFPVDSRWNRPDTYRFRHPSVEEFATVYFEGKRIPYSPKSTLLYRLKSLVERKQGRSLPWPPSPRERFDFDPILITTLSNEDWIDNVEMKLILTYGRTEAEFQDAVIAMSPEAKAHWNRIAGVVVD